MPPYVVWSLAYALLLQDSSVLGALKTLLTAGASAQMYFIAVYLQLTMLTPLLYRLLARCPWLVYAITPLSLEAYEVLTASGIALPILGRLFPMWLVFYVVGLDRKRWRDRLHGKLGLRSLRSARVWRFSSLAASRGFGSAITIWRRRSSN